ncbi:hypothetical protein IH601_04540 [Candidatus Bipolaricaulota bacterium]|nr:hypothetical protein [Candidatus Bipolaricaulota bacterium]TFH09650.1 MAG: hypothetical protein E4H08_05315 [Candidatus Atribacteria bacterium]
MIQSTSAVTTRQITRTWWPLAASWVLMALELPAINIVITRLANPEIHLAAYGSLVFPLALVVEAPIIMLLAASTAICSDWGTYRKVRRFMHILSFGLTAIHALIAFTPLYGFIARVVLSAPEEIIGPARIGLMISLPWTWSIAYRRFNQGVLIRFGHSLSVGLGTIVRLLADCSVLAIGYAIGTIQGTAIAAATIIAGVLFEALYVGLRVRPVLRDQLPEVSPEHGPFSYGSFLKFYIPLSLTSLIFLAARPIFSAGIGRMLDPLASLAVLPVITSVTFLFRAGGVAFSEVVIAMLEKPGSYVALRNFAIGLTMAMTLGILLVTGTRLGSIWLSDITGLSDRLLPLARAGLWFAILLPGLSAIQSWFQGIVMHHKRTHAITEAVILYLVVTGSILFAGVFWGRIGGVYVALIAMTAGEIVRTAWLAWRSRQARAVLRSRDTVTS